MAEAVLGLADLIRINDRNLADVDVPNFLDAAPFMRTNAATLASHDTLHKWLRYTLPDVGFRDANDGREVQVSADVLVQTDCEILDASFRVDLALAREYAKGGQSGWLNRELARHLRAAMFESECQVFRGTAFDAKGFLGFPNDAGLDGLSDAMVFDGGGATASGQTSVYVVRSGPEDVEIVMGRSGEIFVGDPAIQETAGATGTYPAIYTPVTGWLGLKIGSSVTSVARIANVENSLTDDMIYEAISAFGAGREPTAIYMSRKARELLRKSRTATNDAGNPAPTPMDIQGIPIYATDGISNTEAVVA